MTQQQQKEYTWDDTVAALGQDFSGDKVRWADETICYNDVRRFCEAVENDCPLHYDEEAAKAHGYKGILVPWAAYHQTFNTTVPWKPGRETRFPNPDPNADVRFPWGREKAGSEILAEPDVPQVPKPHTTAGLITDLELEFFEPVCVGDRLYQKGNRLVSVNVRDTAVGYGAFMVMESDLYNQRDELVARIRRGGYQYNPHPKRNS